MRYTVSVYLGLLVILMLNGSAQGASVGPFPIASQGQFLVDVVLDPQIDAEVREDVVRVLRSLSGADPVVVERSGRRAIIIGAKSFPAFADKYGALPEDDSCRIAISSGDLHLVGGTRQAVHFAIYTFLEDLGCRWFMPGTLGEVIPKQPNLTWIGDPRLEQPDFAYRDIWWAWGGPPETAEDFRWWRLRNKLAHPQVGHGHNLLNTLPPAKYFDSHPEYYALRDGQRVPNAQLCTSNPDVVRLTIERVNQFFDENPDVLSYSLCPDDNADFCQCDKCTALDAGLFMEGSDLPVVTDRLMVYLNAVAQGIQDRHPGKMVTTYAYANYPTPPVREKVDPHVSVVFTGSGYCSAHGIGDPQCESRQQMKRDLEGWRALCKHVYIYDYDPMPGNAELPWPMYGTHARAMPAYRALGIGGFSLECHNSWAMLFPNFYVSARLMWATDQDLDTLMTDICERFFGEAGPAMRTYYDELDQLIRGYPERVGWGQEHYPEIFTDEVVARLRPHLEEAREAAADPKVEARVAMVATGFDYLTRYLEFRKAAARAAPYAEYRKGRLRLESLADEMYALNKDFILMRAARENLTRKFSALETGQYVPELGMVGHWMLIGPFDSHARRGHQKVFPPEETIDFSASYVGKNGQTIKWFEFQNPESAWQVDLASIMKPKDWVAAYAVCYVTSPEEQTVQFRIGSNDSGKGWLNGEQIWESLPPHGRSTVLDHDIVPVTLPEGPSCILLKVTNMALGWGFCFRITDEDGIPIQGLMYSVRPL